MHACASGGPEKVAYVHIVYRMKTGDSVMPSRADDTDGAEPDLDIYCPKRLILPRAP